MIAPRLDLFSLGEIYPAQTMNSLNVEQFLLTMVLSVEG